MPETDRHHPQIYNKMREHRVRSSILIITFTVMYFKKYLKEKKRGSKELVGRKISMTENLLFMTTCATAKCQEDSLG